MRLIPARSQVGPRRRYLVPEVVQTSSMDCGPAVLKSALEGWGIRVPYGRLREACQTSVDGTSIDAIEDTAGLLGLRAEQLLLPVDHLLLPGVQRLPAIVVTMRAQGILHFVLVWRRVGRFLQIMDPAVGRRWILRQTLLDEIFQHRMEVSVEDWVDWAGSAEFGHAVVRRLQMADVAPGETVHRLEEARKAGDWQELARLDALGRLAGILSGAVSGRAARTATRSLLEGRLAGTGDEALLPSTLWSVTPGATQGQLAVRGVVALSLGGRTERVEEADLPTELRRLRDAPEPSAYAVLADILSTSDRRRIGWLTAGSALFASGAVLETVLLRSLVSLGEHPSHWRDTLTLGFGVLALVLGLLMVRAALTEGMLSLGRRFEIRFRTAFQGAVGFLRDAYFGSRPLADMVERFQALHHLRVLPFHGGLGIRAVLELVALVVAIGWLDPGLLPYALLSALFAIGVPLAAMPHLSRLHMRVRTHAGGLARFPMDADGGAAAIRAHSGERGLMVEQEAVLLDWQRASLLYFRSLALITGLHYLLSLAPVLLLVWRAAGSVEPGGALLLVYWSLRIPQVGQDLDSVMRQFPTMRSLMLRLAEPLSAPREPAPGDETQESTALMPAASSVSIRLHDVSVRRTGHVVLQGANLEIAAGEHIACVGGSGAGKSTLVATLLGLVRADAGQVEIDGGPLDDAAIADLRGRTVWVDPNVHLWNRSLLHNLLFDRGDSSQIGEALASAELYGVLERLPEGLATRLGLGGKAVSGGEGQRIRLGRAFTAPAPGLVLLDEPFVGLEPPLRRALVARALARWRASTFLYITHALDEALLFPRVVVMEGGTVVEDGRTEALRSEATSRFATMLAAASTAQSSLRGHSWTRLTVEHGRVAEHGS